LEYRYLGKTGMAVSRLAFGAGGFGKGMLGVGPGTSQSEAERLVAMALDAGITLFDTADVYGGQASEGILGRALGARRQDIVLATKVHARTGPGPNEVGQSRVHMMRRLENSLRELGTDWIDLYQIHQFDPLTAFEESLRTLDDAVRQGKVRYIGCSNLMAWQIMKASKVAALRGWSEFASVQAYYSVVGRDIERELVPLVKDQDLGLLAYSPLAGGLLSGDISRERAPSDGTRRAEFDFPPMDWPRAYATIDAVAAIAARHDTTVPRIALAWLLSQSHLTSAIVGVEHAGQLTDNLGALQIALTSQDLAELDAASRLPREYPSWATDMSSPRAPNY